MGLISRVSSRTYRDERNLPRIAVEFSTTVGCFRGCEYWWTRHYCEEYRTCSCIRLLSISEVAIAWGNLELVRLLLEYGVNLDGVNLGTLDGDIGDLCRQAQEGTLVNVYKVDAKKKKKK